MAIKKVALVGATGSLGAVVLETLHGSGKFWVTALSRSGSKAKSTLPSQIKVVEVDYDSHESLLNALRGQDAVVATLGSTAITQQHGLIKAALAAGIKRFIPSEFGSDSLNPQARRLPVYARKIKIQEELEKVCTSESGMSYTLVFNSAFLDWGLDHAFIIDLKNKQAELRDGGDRPFSVTTLASVADAVVGVLEHPEETKNKAVRIHNAVVTQNQLIGMAEKNGSGKFQVKNVRTQDELAWGYEELKKGTDANTMAAMMKFLKSAIWGEGYGGEFMEVDNKLLGVKEFTNEEVEAEVVKALKG